MQNNWLQIKFHIVQHSIASHLRSTEWAKEKKSDCAFWPVLCWNMWWKEKGLWESVVHGLWGIHLATAQKLEAWTVHGQRGVLKILPFFFIILTRIYSQESFQQLRMAFLTQAGGNPPGFTVASVWAQSFLALTVLLIYKIICSDPSYIK